MSSSNAPATLRLVLVVEDSDMDAQLLEARLRECSPEIERVIWVDSQLGLAERVFQTQPDLLVCDFHMAGFDTLTTIRDVRARMPYLPILVVSGLIGEELAIQVLKAGANDFVPKSRPERLRLVIERELREAAAARSNRELAGKVDAQRQEFEAIYSQAPIGLWKIDAQGTLYDVNEHGRQLMGGLVTADIEHYGVFEGWWYDTGQRIKDHEWPAAEVIRTRCAVPARLMRVRTFTGSILTLKCGAAPLTAADGTSMGAIVVASDETEGVALREQLAGAEAELRRMSISQLESIERHIASLSRELHDDMGQILSLIKLRLADAVSSRLPSRQRMSGLAETAALVDMAIQRLRQIATDLRPSELIDFGLGEGLRKLARTVECASGLRVSVAETGAAWTQGNAEDLALYRVAQQALTNVVQHADAESVRLTLVWTDCDVSIEVQDDGKGLKADSPQHSGTGLRSMSERIQLLGGTFKAVFMPGAGVVIHATVPRSGPHSDFSSEAAP